MAPPAEKKQKTEDAAPTTDELEVDAKRDDVALSAADLRQISNVPSLAQLRARLDQARREDLFVVGTDRETVLCSNGADARMALWARMARMAVREDGDIDAPPEVEGEVESTEDTEDEEDLDIFGIPLSPLDLVEARVSARAMDMSRARQYQCKATTLRECRLPGEDSD